MNHIVITGADGFIGSHLVRAFVEKGYGVTALIMEHSPIRHRIEGIENVTIVEGDLANWESLAQQLPQAPMAFFHLAWAGVSPEGRNSVAIQMPNIELCLNAARLAHKVNAQRFILPGSTTEYPYCDIINENAMPCPLNAYGAAKVSARFLCQSLCEELKLPYIYMVITGVYSADRVDNNVIYYTISSLLEGKRPAFTRLEQLWDYVHIDDVMGAFVSIAEKGKPGAFYAIGHGDNQPLANYIYAIRDAIDPSLPMGVGEVPYKDGKMPASCVDLTALREDTGFIPQIPFSEGILGVIEAVKNK